MPGLSREDEAVLEECQMQLAELMEMARGQLDGSGVSPVEQVETTRDSMAAAGKVITRYRAREVRRPRPADDGDPT